MAFGTGTHDTTKLCMQMLESYVDGSTELSISATGSGILAVSALLLGAPRAVGVDIDEVAVRVARKMRGKRCGKPRGFPCGRSYRKG